MTTLPKLLNPADPNYASEQPITREVSYDGCGCAGGEVVTVLGEQVREVLEAPQIILLLLILLAAQLTVGLCMTLLLEGRRAELSLLSWVGWERPAVIWRLLWDSWRPALFSGEVGVLLAVAASSIGGVLPTPFVIGAMFVGGPLVGVLLVSMATMGPAWHETKRVYSWR